MSPYGQLLFDLSVQLSELEREQLLRFNKAQELLDDNDDEANHELEINV